MKSITKRIAALAAGAAALATLAGCASGPKGDYYAWYRPYLARLVVDGDNLTFEVFRCNGPWTSKTSKGVLNDERNTVSWTEEGNYYNSDRFISSADDNVVTVGKRVFSNTSTDAGKKLLDEYEEMCSKRDEDWSSPL